MKFENFTLQIPGYKNQTLSFRITNVKEIGNQLSFGCEITEKSKQYDRHFRKLSVVSADLSNDEISEELKSDIKKTKKFIGEIRVTSCSSEAEYRKVLEVRYKAYKAANKTRDNQTVEDMADEFDRHAVILVATIGSNLVGTMRIVMREPGKALPCEKSFDLSKIAQIVPEEAAEVSRFAIDPLFQGSDLFIAISRKLVIELVAKQIKYPLCLATQKLAPSYQGLGAVKISEPIPHPTLANETLTLYWLVPQRVFEAKTSSLSWLFVIKPSLNLLRRVGLLKFSSKGLHHYLLFILELLRMKLKRRKK